MARPRKLQQRVSSPSQDQQLLPVAAYLRVSTDEQAESHLGLDAQRHQVQAMCIVKGWPEPVIYEDAGVSGTIALKNRESGKRLLADIEAGSLRAIIVASIDRVGRRASIIMDFAHDAKDKGVDFISCRESWDTGTPQGYFVLTIYAGLAQLERDLISQRTIAALSSRKKKYGYIGGPLPFGYDRDGEEIFVVEEEAVIVRKIFAMRAKKATLQAIATKVGELTGRKWGTSSIAVVIEHERVYKGGLIQSDELYRWPVILR